ATDVPIPDNYPVVGRDAFRTATGVHAAAVVKAWKKGDRDLMDAVYSAIPASLVGRQQEIEVGPMSGKSNVVFWLEQHGIPCSDPIVDRVFARAKSSTTVLTEAEILAEVYRKKGSHEGTKNARDARWHLIRMLRVRFAIFATSWLPLWFEQVRFNQWQRR